MQKDINTAKPDLDVRILGVNVIGEEDYDSLIAQESDLPWLQDNGTEDVWDKWHANWRDVMILNAANDSLTVYNLTTYDLNNPANYDTLKAMLLRYATVTVHPASRFASR